MADLLYDDPLTDEYYSGDRLPDYGEEAMTASLAALNTAA